MLAGDEEFCAMVRAKGQELYRDLPWRNIDDAYGVLISEVMLQQTQVKRVLGRWESWMERFPTATDLASAPLQVVLEEWQGMGYNRRAINLKKAAEAVVAQYNGVIPSDRKLLLDLPGIGPATAAGIRVFAFQEPDIYLETNVRTVYLHEYFPGVEGISDKEITAIVERTCPDQGVRAWYYALLDYGNHLKQILPNPSRRSKHYKRQSTFEGSHRQKRAFLLRCVLDGTSAESDLIAALGEFEEGKGREPVDREDVKSLLKELEGEGFIVSLDAGFWGCPL